MRSKRSQRVRSRRPQCLVACALLCVGLALGASSCGSNGDPAGASRDKPATAAEGAERERMAAVRRSGAIEAAVAQWGRATSLGRAKAAAEEARNLITGPRVQGASDADGDGRVKRVRAGLLPGEDGSPGLATPVRGACVSRDVLGGSWERPRERWAELLRLIRDWSPSNNRFPELASHAQRTVGWATLTLGAGSIEEAREYAGHASGHAAIVTQALRSPAAESCPGG